MTTAVQLGVSELSHGDIFGLIQYVVLAVTCRTARLGERRQFRKSLLMVHWSSVRRLASRNASRRPGARSLVMCWPALGDQIETHVQAPLDRGSSRSSTRRRRAALVTGGAPRRAYNARLESVVVLTYGRPFNLTVRLRGSARSLWRAHPEACPRAVCGGAPYPNRYVLGESNVAASTASTS